MAPNSSVCSSKLIWKGISPFFKVEIFTAELKAFAWTPSEESSITQDKFHGAIRCLCLCFCCFAASFLKGDGKKVKYSNKSHLLWSASQVWIYIFHFKLMKMFIIHHPSFNKPGVNIYRSSNLKYKSYLSIFVGVKSNSSSASTVSNSWILQS